MYNKILALDQSSRISGWSFFQNEQLTDYGHWTHTADDIAVRIYGLCQEIQQKIQEYQPDIVLLENIALTGGDAQTFQKLAQVQGAILYLCRIEKIKYKIVYPNEWRKECNLLRGQDKRRNNQKKIAQEWVLNTFGKKCTEDEADAICIGYSEIHIQQNELDFS